MVLDHAFRPLGGHLDRAVPGQQISVPIAALLDGASEVRKGNLRHRVNVRARY